ncbi:MAG: VOC family protein [Rubrivivax sp.]|nr:VOC family protein [Rubrivivax sp.]
MSPPRQSLFLISLLVRDHDEALAFYCGVLGFECVEDKPVPEQHKRWVVIAPPGGASGQRPHPAGPRVERRAAQPPPQ